MAQRSMPIAACTAPAPVSPAELTHCTTFNAMSGGYCRHRTFHHTGQRARADLAFDACRHGRYDEGIAD